MLRCEATCGPAPAQPYLHTHHRDASCLSMWGFLTARALPAAVADANYGNERHTCITPIATTTTFVPVIPMTNVMIPAAVAATPMVPMMQYLHGAPHAPGHLYHHTIEYARPGGQHYPLHPGSESSLNNSKFLLDQATKACEIRFEKQIAEARAALANAEKIREAAAASVAAAEDQRDQDQRLAGREPRDGRTA